MNTREIQNIFMGDTQGEKLYLGDELVWPVETHVYITALTLNVATAITDSGVASVSYSPANAETNIVYSSSDNTVAVIDGQGNITVLQDGQVTICATDTLSNISDCKVVNVSVTGPDTGITPSTSITLNVDSAITDYGLATVTVGPSNADVDLVFSSSDNGIATIDQNGNITVLDDGQVTICVTDRNTGLRDCDTITVTKTDTPPIPPIPSGGCIAFVITYNVTSNTTPTRIMNQHEVTSTHSRVYLADGYEITKSTGYTFQDVGLQQLIYVFDIDTVPYDTVGMTAGWYGLDTVVDVVVVYRCGSGDLHFYGNTFDFCTNLQSIRFVGTGMELVTIVGPRGSSSLTNVVLPNNGSLLSITNFGDVPYTDTVNTVVTLPEGMTSIYDFLGRPGGLPASAPCNATQIIIPSTITSLRYRNFTNCTNLESITILATTPPTLGDVDYSLGDTSATFPIFVPAGSVQDYKRNSDYQNYAWRIQAIQ